jgi:hypothetical protein
MAIIKTGTLTVGTGGVAQNLILGFVPDVLTLWNDNKLASGTGVAYAQWLSSMANASAYIQTLTAGAPVWTKLTTNGVTPFQTTDANLYPTTNLTITGISQAAQASITATHAFTAKDVGVTVVTFHQVVGMIQINTLSGVVQSVTGTTSFTVNINTTAFTTYVSGGIANIITGTPALQGGSLTSGNALGFPPNQQGTTQVLNTALFNQGMIGVTLGTSLMVTTGDLIRFEAVLNAPFTS